MNPGKRKTTGVDLGSVHKRYRVSQNPNEIVNRARAYTFKAIKKLADLMDGEAGERDEITVDPATGFVTKTKVKIEVPPAVQKSAAELLLDRGWGKAPQSILIKEDGPDTQDGETIYDRIKKIKLAREISGSTTDLEASEQDEPVIIDLPRLEAPAERAEDMI